MTKPLVYLDQNVLGLHLEGSVDLTNAIDVQWAYSKEHFAEIRRSNSGAEYLELLDGIGANMLDLEMKDLKITGAAKLIQHGTAKEHYLEYCEGLDGVCLDEKIFDPLQAWANGGGDENLLRDLPGNIAEQLQVVMEGLPPEFRPTERPGATEEFRAAIEQITAHGNDIDVMRSALGVARGRIGNIAGDNQIQQIWEIIRPYVPGVTIEQFFGFEPYYRQGLEPWPIYLGIIACCAMFDLLGFQAEKKCRKLDLLPNVKSDAVHVAMAAFCSAAVSADKRLVRRAKAIYEHKRIGTQCIYIRQKSG